MNAVRVPKLAEDPSRFGRTFRQFPSGRAAFKSILASLEWPAQRTLLLPAYIGYSSREGSGLYDPVRELGLQHAFYRMTAKLEVDVDHLSEQLARHPGAVLLLVHYFGRVDPAYREVVRVAKEANAEIIEDEAHALLTDLVGGASGRAGDHAFLSLHKLLPVRDGGARILNRTADSSEPAGCPALQRFDLAEIARVRVRNHALLREWLEPLGDDLEALWPKLSGGEVPQTYPVLLKRAISGGREVRDRVYARMNELGFGIVSLYHTLIAQLDPAAYASSGLVSRSILNLPVHQDLTPEQLQSLVSGLDAVLKEFTVNG